MTTATRIRLGLVLGFIAAIGGCAGPCSKVESITGPKLVTNGIDFTTYVAVGTSLSSGYESGGLVNRHQVHSFPSLLARQLGKTVQLDGHGTFTQPTMDGDGIPQLLAIKSYDPLVIDTLGRTLGSPTNIAQATPYHNLGVPGAVLFDLENTARYGSQTYLQLIARAQVPLLTQALSLAPTLMSLEYGANEVLGPTVNFGLPPNPNTHQIYAAQLTSALNTIHAASPATRVAVFNVPQVTSIPFFSTLPALTVDTTSGLPVPLLATTGPLQLGDLVLLPAANLIATGTGIPPGGFNFVNPRVRSNGQKLPESLILRAAEVLATVSEIDAMNDAVDSVATRPFVTLVDLAGLLSSIATGGITIGGRIYSSEFVTGGLFSLDGVHPNDLGYALIANQMIEAINTGFGSQVPKVNVAEFASASASAAKPALGNGIPTRIAGLSERLRLLFPSTP